MTSKVVNIEKVKDRSPLPERVFMSLEDWISVRDNPRQRDTEKHARKARHLFIPCPSHHVVSAARLPSGELIKLDGHTRCFLWETEKIPQPRQLAVDVYDVPDLKAATELYIVFDNRGAVETVADQISGALKQSRTVFQSPLLRSGRFGNSVKSVFIAMMGDSISRHPEFTYKAVDYFLPQLRLLDQCDPKPDRFIGGIVMAALVTFKRYGSNAVDFWTRYSHGLGTKLDGEMDAVQALEKAVDQFKIGRVNTNSGRRELMARAISAFEADRRGHTYTIAVKKLQAKSLRKYLIVAATMGNWDE